MQLVCVARGSPDSRCSVPGRGIAMLMGLSTFLLGQVLRSDDVTARTRLHVPLCLPFRKVPKSFTPGAGHNR